MTNSSEQHAGEKRRNGSTLVGLAAAALLCGVALALVCFERATSLHPNLAGVAIRTDEMWIDVSCCLLFAGILIWWAGSGPAGLKFFVDNRHWGIGNPTVTMVITVVTATVAIITFTHDFFKPEVSYNAPVAPAQGEAPPTK